MTATDRTDSLAELIAAKLQIVELLERLAHRQLDLIEQGEMTDLLKVLSAKQTVLDQLHRLERKLDPFRSEEPDQRIWRNTELRAQCQAQSARCATLLESALGLEKKADAAMRQRRDLAAGALESANTAAGAVLAYSTASSATAASPQVRYEG